MTRNQLIKVAQKYREAECKHCEFKRETCALDKQTYVNRYIESQDTCPDYTHEASPVEWKEHQKKRRV